MKVITYRVILLEPVLVTQLDGDPNSASAFDYLPGSVQRGAIIGNYCRGNRLLWSQFKADDPVVRRLFFDGTTRYLNGYPLDRLKQRTLPTPLSWQRKKGEESPLYDLAVEPPIDANIQWQSVGKPFCFTANADVGLVQPDHHISVHTARTRRFGRAMPRATLERIAPEELGTCQ